MLTPRAVTLLAAAAATGCSPFDPDLGAQPFLCGDRNPRCPDEYVCVERVGGDNVCLREGAVADAGGDANLQCSADTHEPNDTIEVPTPLTLPASGGAQMIDGVICPETDLDIYRFDVDTTGKNARIELQYDATAGALDVGLLNSTGVLIRTGTPTNNNPNKLRADFTNLAKGTYYGRVKGMGHSNTYATTFLVTTEPLPP